MEITLKKNYVISFMCLIIAACALLSKFINLDSPCSDVLLDMWNPNSYINKVTKPFLIELVKNATANTTK